MFDLEKIKVKNFGFIFFYGKIIYEEINFYKKI